MITSLGVLFACIAPIILLFTLAWLAVAGAAWAHACRFILVPGPQGQGFDSGGMLWPSAVHKQVVALVCAQLVLLAVQAINECFVGVAILLALVGATLAYAGALKRRFQPLAEDLPLERCMQLDAEMWSTARPHPETVPPALRQLLAATEMEIAEAPAEAAGEAPPAARPLSTGRLDATPGGTIN